MNEDVNFEGGKIVEVISQIINVTKELKEQILPDLKSKSKSIPYSTSKEECKNIVPMAEGSQLLTVLEEHKQDLVNMVNDIVRKIEL